MDTDVVVNEEIGAIALDLCEPFTRELSIDRLLDLLRFVK
jgi:hypothetical protein